MEHTGSAIGSERAHRLRERRSEQVRAEHEQQLGDQLRRLPVAVAGVVRRNERDKRGAVDGEGDGVGFKQLMQPSARNAAEHHLHRRV